MKYWCLRLKPIKTFLVNVFVTIILRMEQRNYYTTLLFLCLCLLILFLNLSDGLSSYMFNVSFTSVLQVNHSLYMQIMVLGRGFLDLQLLFRIQQIIRMGYFDTMINITPFIPYLQWWTLLVLPLADTLSITMKESMDADDYSPHAFVDLCEVEVYGEFKMIFS